MKNCKYFDSYLDTETDITRRKQLSMASFLLLKSRLTNKKISLRVRMRIFNAYVTNIFLYNSELWTLTKKLENMIDVFHRKLLRHIIGRFYPKNISNLSLYKVTKQNSWSNVIRMRRLRWTGHILRLDINSPCNRALNIYKTHKGKLK